MSKNYAWKEKKYDITVAVYVCLPSYNVGQQLLWSTDLEWYTCYSNCLISTGNEKKRKRTEAQAMSRARRLQNL